MREFFALYGVIEGIIETIGKMSINEHGQVCGHKFGANASVNVVPRHQARQWLQKNIGRFLKKELYIYGQFARNIPAATQVKSSLFFDLGGRMLN